MELDLTIFDKDVANYLKKILDRTAVDVWKVKRKAEGKFHRNFWYRYIRRVDRLRGWLQQIPVATPSISPRAGLHDIDPHLLYYSWHALKASPVLVWSHVSLQQLGPALGPAATKWTDFKKVRVRGDKPSIEVSEEEIAALSLVMGVELHAEQQYLPHGVGAFGSLLLSETEDCMTKLKVVYHDRPRDEVIGGSGYSMLFARHMACGCLPFAIDTGSGDVHTVDVNAAVWKSIQTGNGACDEDVAEVDGQVHYLNLLSPLKTNFYRAAWPVSGASPGSLRPASGVIVQSCWPRAVTRIAFGGLAPMATQTLINAVKFTVGGEMTSSSEQKKLNELMNSIIGNATMPGGGQIPLFGATQHKLASEMAAGNKIHFPTPENSHNIRQAVKELAKCTALLEYLIARTPAHPLGKRNNIFNICCNDITAWYSNSALWAAQATNQYTAYRPIPNIGPYSFIVKTFDDAINNLGAGVNPFPVQLCADVARCLIMTWTKTVRIVDWSGEVPGAFRTVPLSSLPDVAVWE